MSPAKQLCVTTKKMFLSARHTDRRTDRQTDARQSYPYVPLCFAGDTKTTTLEKMTAHVIFWIRIYSEFRRNLFSANAHIHGNSF